MAFREVPVIEVKEVLRQWLRGHGFREAGRLAQVDRKTARRYVDAGQRAGLVREAGEEQLTVDVIASVVETVRPTGPGVHGASWSVCNAHKAYLKSRIDEGLNLTKVRALLARQSGVSVPYRTLHRFAVEELDFRRQSPTVRVDDGKPGEELQVDFGRLGMLEDATTGKKRAVWALIMTPVCSRYTFVWLTYQQTIQDVVAGLEAAWAFFGGVFHVIVPDNMKAIVDRADPTDPRINVTFMEYAQSRGFTVDPARVRSPKDKPRVERAVQYVRGSFFEGEHFTSLAVAQEAAEQWCRVEAGERDHGTTHRRPRDAFVADEQPVLLAAPTARYDVPIHTDALVVHDHHISFANALYSVPTDYIGERVQVIADSQLVRIFHAARLIKTHPRLAPGGRSTDPDDYPEEVRVYATRDIISLQKRATEAGPHVADFFAKLVAGPAPWQRMRLAYRLLGLVKRFGAARVNDACGKALALDVVDVMRVERMLQRALESDPAASAPTAAASTNLRFLRPVADYAVKRCSPTDGDSHEQR